MSRLSGKRLLAVAATLMLGSGVLAGCAVGGGDDSSEDGKLTLTFLTGDDDQILRPSKAVADAFEKENPDISIKIETQPGGSEGDNLIKTRLATGEMNDMFLYNSGALLQALDPQQNLTPLTDRPWVAEAMPSFLDSTKAGDDQFGAPFGTAFGGGVGYNIGVYEDLGLTVPTTWDEFLSNSEKIKDAGITPVMGTYGDTWTSQIVMLADFHNILVQDPEWADEYTNNQAKYADEPGLSSFQKIADLSDAGLLNEDFASAKLDEGLERVASGEAAQYPMLTLSFGQMVSNYPESADKVGFFPIPGDDPATNGLTAWMGNAVYIPKTTTGDKLEAAQASSPTSWPRPRVATRRRPSRLRPVPTWSSPARFPTTSRAGSWTCCPTSRTRRMSAWRWSSSARSRARRSSRSPLRSARGSAALKTVRRGTTRMSSSRLSSSDSRAGELRPAPGTFVISSPWPGAGHSFR